jgi:hypothetical protein
VLAGYEHGAAAADLLTVAALFGVSGPTWALSRGEMRTAEKRTGLPAGSTALRSALPPWLVSRLVTEGGAEDDYYSNRWHGRADAPAWGAPIAAARHGGYEEAEAVTGGDTTTTDADWYYRARLLIADDFIESLLVFDSFVAAVQDNSGENGIDIAEVARWCEARGLELSALTATAERREHIASEVVLAGLNPARRTRARLALAKPADFTRRVSALKKCLHAALSPRLLTWDEKRAGYYDRRNTRVKAPGLLSDRAARTLGTAIAPARWILTDMPRLMPVRSAGPVVGGAAVSAPAPLLYSVETNLVSVLDGHVVPDGDSFCARTVEKTN